METKNTKHELDLIDKIVGRAATTTPWIDRTSLAMDLCATHANGNPLNFEALLAADPFNFSHDVYGIMRHIDRSTGELEGFFVPRYSKVA